MVDFLQILEDKIDFSPTERGVARRWFRQVERDNLFANQISSSGGGGFVQALEAGNVQVDYSEGITIRNPQTGFRTIRFDPDGDAWFGNDLDDPDTTTMFVISNEQGYNGETFGQGDLLLGSNSSGKANMWWDASAGKLYFRSGTTTSVEIGAGGIIATWGQIGGWTINATDLRDSSNAIILNSSTPSISIGAGLLLNGASQVITVGASTPQINIDGENKVIASSNYSAGAAGFQIRAENGDAEFNNIVARGSLRASVFTLEDVSSIGGKFYIAKAAAEVYEDVTTAASFTLKVKASDSGASMVAVNDVLLIQAWNGTEVIAIWMTVDTSSTASGVTTLSVTLENGGTGKNIQKGMSAVNYGPANNGIVAIDAGATPRIRISSHAGAPWTTQTTHVVIGDMYAQYQGTPVHRYGVGIGDYSGGNYLSYNADVADEFVVSGGGGAVRIRDAGLSLLSPVASGGYTSSNITWYDASEDMTLELKHYTWSGTMVTALNSQPPYADALNVSIGMNVWAASNKQSSAGISAQSENQTDGSGAGVTSYHKADNSTQSFTEVLGALRIPSAVTSNPSSLVYGDVVVGRALAVGVNDPGALVDNAITTIGGISVGDNSPTAGWVHRGNLHLDYSGSGSYGFIHSINNLHLYQNQYYDGAWKALGTGKVGGFQTSMSSDIPFLVQSSQASYTADQAPTVYQNFVVTNGSVLKTFTSGTNTWSGEIYSDASWLRFNQNVTQNIYTLRYLRADGGLTGYAQTGDPSDGWVAGYGFRSFYSTTEVGRINGQDSTWFRINQDVAKNIYTPRHLMAAASVGAGGSTLGNNGDLLYTANLRPYRNGGYQTYYTYFASSSYYTSTSWDGDAKASQTTTLDLSALFGLPGGIKAVMLRLVAKDTSSDQDSYYLIAGPSSTYADQVACYAYGGYYKNAHGIVSCNGNGDIVVKVNSYSGSTNCYIRIHGVFW